MSERDGERDFKLIHTDIHSVCGDGDNDGHKEADSRQVSSPDSVKWSRLPLL